MMESASRTDESMAEARPKGRHLAFAAVLAVLLVGVGLQQAKIDRQRVSVSFYRWIEKQRARALHPDTVVTVEKGEEEEFFERVKGFVDQGIKKMDPGVGGLADPQLKAPAVWNIASTPLMKDYRKEFLVLLKAKKVKGVESDLALMEPGVGAYLGTLMLGFRNIVADLLWLKVDEYWHKGLLNRMLPMMYTVVRLDPHFLDAYAIGAWHLAYNAYAAVDDPEEKQVFVTRAIAFLQDGIERNPTRFKLYFELGYGIYYLKTKEYEKAVVEIERAVRCDDHEPVHERMLLHAYERSGRYEDSLRGWIIYREEHPDNLVAPRFVLRERGLILESDGREDEAYRIWQEMYEKYPGNEFADVHITRIDAARAERKGRYQEAITLYQQWIDKKYPTVYDEALENIERLRQKMSEAKSGA